MKKTPDMRLIFQIVTLTIFYFILSPANAQLAIRGGMNVSEIDFDDDFFDAQSRTGIQLGMSYDIALGERIYIRPGAVFSIKGYKSLNETGDLNYLEVPLSMIFYVVGSENGIYLEAGPYAGALLGEDLSVNIDIKNLDLGFNIGAGIKLGRFGIGVTYGYGLANIIDGEFSTNENQARNKNVGIYALVYF